MINRISFPEYTNAQINAALLCDKLNEVINYLNENEEPKKVVEKTLRPGVQKTSRGTYFKSGKGGGFVKKEDAYE